MITDAREIGGMEERVEVRKNLALRSRGWRLGVVDHGRMIRAGLFGGVVEEEEDLFKGTVKGNRSSVVPTAMLRRVDDEGERGVDTSSSTTRMGRNDVDLDDGRQWDVGGDKGPVLVRKSRSQAEWEGDSRNAARSDGMDKPQTKNVVLVLVRGITESLRNPIYLALAAFLYLFFLLNK